MLNAEITDTTTRQVPDWSLRYELGAVSLLTLGIGLVGLDRWIIAPLLPAIMKDLHLTYQDAGNLIGVLALSWGVFAIVFGRLSDRIGRRRILVPSLIIFSLMSCVSGLASGLLTLMLARGVMGATEGAFLPVSTAATAEASPERRRGFNQGFQLCSFAWLGLGLGPLIAIGLLQLTSSWRWVFCLAAIPGLMVAFGLLWVIREPSHLAGERHAPALQWRALFRYHNVPVAIALVLCALCCVFVLAGMLPSYLSDFLHLRAASSARVLSAIGFGGGAGQLVFMGLSDRIGRKPATALCFAGALVFLIWFSRIGDDPVVLFWTLFACAAFAFGVVGLATGPIATEAVPNALMASAIGIVTGTGEIFGGGIAPSAAGWVAQHFGIDKVLRVSMTGLAIGLVLTLLLRETAPLLRARAAARANGSLQA